MKKDVLQLSDQDSLTEFAAEIANRDADIRTLAIHNENLIHDVGRLIEALTFQTIHEFILRCDFDKRGDGKTISNVIKRVKLLRELEEKYDYIDVFDAGTKIRAETFNPEDIKRVHSLLRLLEHLEV